MITNRLSQQSYPPIAVGSRDSASMSGAPELGLLGGAFALMLAGAAGLYSDSSMPFHPASTTALRSTFALLLLALIAARYLWRRNVQTLTIMTIRRDFDRVTARAIYILLYVLVGFQVCLDIGANHPLRTDHCQFYLACGLVALILSRGLSAIVSHPPPGWTGRTQKAYSPL